MMNIGNEPLDVCAPVDGETGDNPITSILFTLSGDAYPARKMFPESPDSTVLTV